MDLLITVQYRHPAAWIRSGGQETLTEGEVLGWTLDRLLNWLDETERKLTLTTSTKGEPCISEWSGGLKPSIELSRVTITCNPGDRYTVLTAIKEVLAPAPAR